MRLEINKITLAILSGLLLTASFPKVGLSYLIWIALVPLLASIHDLEPKKAFQAGLIAGFVHFITLAYWLLFTMHTYGYLPWSVSISVLILFTLYLGMFVAAFSFIISKIKTKPIGMAFFAPAVWVGLEWIRSHLFTGVSWEILGYSQFANLPLIQISDILGSYSLSYLIVFANINVFVLYLAITKKRFNSNAVPKIDSIIITTVLVFMLAGSLIYGTIRIQEVDEAIRYSPTLKTAVVQASIDQAIKWDPETKITSTKKYLELSMSTPGERPDLIIWPETSTPFYLGYNRRMTTMIIDGVRKSGTTFIIGSPSFKKEGEKTNFYNSAYLLQPNGRITDRYDKIHLVPFGEYTPLKDYIPFIGKMVAQSGDFKPGVKNEPLLMKKGKIGILICYEVVVQELSRKMVKNGADVLVTITNDAWFGRTSGPYQHFTMAVFRAVENRRSIARAANTGFSGFIDPAGRILSHSKLYEEIALSRDIPKMDEITFYTKYGDFFAIACMVLSMLVILISLVRKR